MSSAEFTYLLSSEYGYQPEFHFLNMTLNDYKRLYIDLIATALASAVKREAAVDKKLREDPARLAELENLKDGLVVLALVALLEETFLDKESLKALRSFSRGSSFLPANVSSVHLSCYVYIRDCVGHNAVPKLLGPGENTKGFQDAVSSGEFPFATVASDSGEITIANTHELHLIILRMFGEAV